VVIFITLLAGFVPLLQVTFFALLEDFYPGRLAVKDRDKTHRITGVILINIIITNMDLENYSPRRKPYNGDCKCFQRGLAFSLR
jgi:hypothetical protein